MRRPTCSRRDFLVAGAAAVAAPHVLPSRVLGLDGATPPSETVRVGIAGLGGRARWILLNEDLPGARIVAVADCELPRCDQMAAAVAKDRPDLQPASWKKYADIRQLLDQEKLDAVFVETTTHARVWSMMHVLAAGCDVYGEKPLTLTIAEGRILSDAARKLGRILQTGTQQRSMPINAHGSQLVRDGAIFRGEKGNIEILRGHARANPPELLKDAPPDTPGGPKESIPHIANFIHCVRTREKPAADAETGHRATTVCYLINICRKLGRKLQWNPQTEKFIGDDEANQLLARPRRQGYELPAVG